MKTPVQIKELIYEIFREELTLNLCSAHTSLREFNSAELNMFADGFEEKFGFAVKPDDFDTLGELVVWACDEVVRRN